MAAQIWNPAQANSHVLFSNGNLTVNSDIGQVQAAVYGLLASADTGGKYWELVITMSDSNDGYGIANTASSIADYAWLGGSADTVGWNSGGNVYNNGSASVTNWPSYSSGNRLCFALDQVNNLLYGRVANGAWNAGSADPTTGSGGYAIPAAVYANPMCPAVVLANNLDLSSQVTGYFTANSWLYAPPSGFSQWDPAIFPFFPQLGALQKGIR